MNTFEIGADARLADELVEGLRPERGLGLVLVALHRRERARVAHCANSLSPKRISSSVRASRPALPTASEIAAEA